MPTPIKSDTEKLRTIVEVFQKADPYALYNFAKSKEIQYELKCIADNYEKLEERIFKLERNTQ